MRNIIKDLLVGIGVSIGCIGAFIFTILVFIFGVILQVLPIALVIGIIFVFLRIFGVI